MASKIVLTVGFIVLIGWDIWEALGNLIGLPAFYRALSIESDTPWVLLVIGVVLPVVLLVVGLRWAWSRRPLVGQAAAYLLILAAHSCLALSLIAAEQAWRAQALIATLG